MPDIKWYTINFIINNLNRTSDFCDSIIQNIKNQFDNNEDKSFQDIYSRSVYVIRFFDTYVVQYAKKHSPVLYIGKGNLRQRLESHINSWLSEISEELKYYNFELLVSVPKRRNCNDFYECVEGILLEQFLRIYNQLPIRNRRAEYKHKKHNLRDIDTNSINYALNIHKATQKYKWSIKPITKSNLYETYNR